MNALANVILFFFNDTATTEIYTLSLHDALPIYADSRAGARARRRAPPGVGGRGNGRDRRQGGRVQARSRSEEHTSELQSRQYLVCRLLLEKKKHTFTFPSRKSTLSPLFLAYNMI